jgi:hypothetical protein
MTKFRRRRGREVSVKEEILFECLASFSVSFQIILGEKIFFILLLIFRPVS